MARCRCIPLCSALVRSAPYRPWRKAETTTVPPWQAPISTTETLWYLGLIYCDPPKPQPGRVQHYVLPADLLPHLAVHLAPAAVDPALRPQPQPGRLDTDVPFRCLDAAVAWSINPWSAASFARFLNAVSR